jgi:peptide subunit release factor 1 (eRF1)
MISIHIPEGATPPDLDKEIGSAKNIKDRNTRNNTLAGLNKIANYLSINPKKTGISIYWNDEKLIVEPYDRKQKHYYCGKELLIFKQGKTLIYQILAVDYDEVAYAEVFSDGEIRVLWKDTSFIPHKMKPGGQSAHRFSQNRDNEITAWFKKIDRYLMKVSGEIIVDMSDVYYKRFYNTLHTYNKAKVKERLHTSYGGLTGIYQVVNMLEKRK